MIQGDLVVNLDLVLHSFGVEEVNLWGLMVFYDT